MLGSLIRSRVFLSFALAAGLILALAAILVAISLGGSDDEGALSSLDPTATSDISGASGLPGSDPASRLIISRAKIDAPISLKTVAAEGGELPTPEGPDGVVLYDFAAHAGLGGYPGAGGRIVIGGHVDYAQGPCQNGRVPPPCRAVFWDLKDLASGDVIELHLSDGVHRYRVTGSEDIAAGDQAQWDVVWTATQGESIALLTCGGDFNRVTREYASRHVVYGDRIAD